MKTIYFLPIILLFSLPLFGQNITAVDVNYFDNTAYNGKIKIIQDSQLENFIESHVGLNKKRRGFYGYRVKIYAQNHQNARSEANAIRIGFNQDGQEAYVNYSEPNFEVYVGDYINRFDAIALLHKVKGKYPEAYVVRTIVSYPK